jgi:type IV pilus assembly protein PilE
MRTKANTSGFTLIELMVTVVIIAILAAVALPQYRNYAIRGKIPEATSGLSNNRVKLEQFFQDNRTYIGGPVSGSTTSKYFTFSGTTTASTYTLTATGIDAMSGFQYSIDQTGAKASTVTGVSGWSGNSCWVTKQGGQC